MTGPKQVVLNLVKTSRGWKLKPSGNPEPLNPKEQSKQGNAKSPEDGYVKAGLDPQENKTNQKKFKNSLSRA